MKAWNDACLFTMARSLGRLYAEPPRPVLMCVPAEPSVFPVCRVASLPKASGAAHRCALSRRSGQLRFCSCVSVAFWLMLPRSLLVRLQVINIDVPWLALRAEKNLPE